jgi:hypothetical protein
MDEISFAVAAAIAAAEGVVLEDEDTAAMLDLPARRTRETALRIKVCYCIRVEK